MKALITGGSGFVGKYLKAELEKHNDQVFSPDIRELDICNYKQVEEQLKSVQPDVVYHLAGIAFVPHCEANFGKALEVNVAGTDNVLKAARSVCPNAVVILVGSGEVYGKTANSVLPLKESDPLEPANNYSLTKSFAEQLALRAIRIFSQKVVIMRPFNHIGPGQSTNFAIASFAEQIKSIKAGKTEPVIKVGNLSSRRDLTDVRDIVRGYRLAAQKGEGIYNLCSNISHSMQSILEKMIEISGVKIEIETDPSRLRASDIAESRGSYEKARAELGWKPEILLGNSLKDCLL